MKHKSSLITGTLLLTTCGIITKLIGFYNKIYLSHVIGPSGIGIFQLAFPIYVLCLTISSLSIETGISNYVAKSNSKNHSQNRPYLYCGIALTLILSSLCALILFSNSALVSTYITGDSSCAPLLEILSFSIPFACIHSCINGYYYGQNKTGIPGASLLIEQVFRVGGVYIISTILLDKGIKITPAIAAQGVLCGEISAALFSITAVTINTTRKRFNNRNDKFFRNLKYLKNLITYCLPLTINRLTINILQSFESVLIPGMLQNWGASSIDSLNIYGILTGMAIPLVFFPATITNSASILLLPKISKANYNNNNHTIVNTIEKTLQFCLIFGIFFTGIFFMYGKALGNLIFSNPLSGAFIEILSFICPFLYLTTTITSMLHGLNKTKETLIINIISILIRIVFIICIVPIVGIKGYLWGFLVSLLIKTLLCNYILKKNTAFSYNHIDWILIPIISLMISLNLASVINIPSNLFVPKINELINVGAKALATGILYLIVIYLFYHKKRVAFFTKR